MCACAVCPPQCGGEVGPFHSHHVLEAYVVVAGEEGKADPVAAAKDIIHLGVDVVEVEGVVLEVGDEFHEEVEIRPTSSHEDRAATAVEGSVYGGFGSKQSDGAAAVPSVAVAALCVDVEHSRRCSAEGGRYHSFI